MSARFICDSTEEKINGSPLPKNHAKYKITSCFVNVLAKWIGYDPAAHFVGAFIAWPKKFAKKSTATSASKCRKK